MILLEKPLNTNLVKPIDLLKRVFVPIEGPDHRFRTHDGVVYERRPKGIVRLTPKPTHSMLRQVRRALEGKQ